MEAHEAELVATWLVMFGMRPITLEEFSEHKTALLIEGCNFGAMKDKGYMANFRCDDLHVNVLTKFGVAEMEKYYESTRGRSCGTADGVAG